MAAPYGLYGVGSMFSSLGRTGLSPYTAQEEAYTKRLIFMSRAAVRAFSVPDRRDLEGLVRVLHRAGDARHAGEVQQVVAALGRPLQRLGVADVALDDADLGLLVVLEVAPLAAPEVVVDHDLVAAGHEGLDEVAADEAGSPGHEVLGHWGSSMTSWEVGTGLPRSSRKVVGSCAGPKRGLGAWPPRPPGPRRSQAPAPARARSRNHARVRSSPSRRATRGVQPRLFGAGDVRLAPLGVVDHRLRRARARDVAARDLLHERGELEDRHLARGADVHRDPVALLEHREDAGARCRRT